MDYTFLFDTLRQAGFDDWVNQLERWNQDWFSERHHGDFKRWQQALDDIPELKVDLVDLSQPAITVDTVTLDSRLLQALQALRPWRKGPFQLSDVYIDTEWRSDYKWDRVLSHLAPLGDRRILDVGCGNGYHMWRMLNESPSLVLGVDPSVLFNMQFQAVQHFIADARISMLPITLQQMPNNMQWFDTIFSMGVLYHRRSPFDHLLHLKSLLKEGGELCLETLVIEGGKGQVLVPHSRYARMNNVWFLPSVAELEHWLTRCGFQNVRTVDVNKTTIEEQRSTDWMQFESLPQCLDPVDQNKTVEGYPAPIRAVLLANR